MTKRTVVVGVVSALAAATLAACGTLSASHVVKGTVPVVATTSTTVPSTPSTTATSAATTPAPSPALSAQTLDQIDAELGSLDNSLNMADADLKNPQGDS